jgi:NADH dehydrogenase FAD-containing subunit
VQKHIYVFFVLLDMYINVKLKSVAYPKLFALGGCAKLATPEPYIGVPKIEAQAKTIAKNIKAILDNDKVSFY